MSDGYDPTCFGCFWSSEIASVKGHVEVAVPCVRHEPKETVRRAPWITRHGTTA